MLNAFLRWIFLAFALILVAKIVPGMEIEGFLAALFAIVIIALVNIILRPLFLFLTLPINLLTLGLFTLVVNAVLFGIAAFFTPGFSVDGIFPALLGSFLFSLLSIIVNFISGQLSPA